MRNSLRTICAAACLAVLIALIGCLGGHPPKAPATVPIGATARGDSRIQAVDLNDPLHPTADDNAIVLTAAKNEWASFAVQISHLPLPAKTTAYSFHIQPPRMDGAGTTIGVDEFSAAQILPMPVDVNRAGFVRHTGLSAGKRPLPRALLPITMDHGIVNLAGARDPADPTNPQSHPTDSAEPLLFWIDLHIPVQTKAGEYVTNCDLLTSDSSIPLASVPIKITIYDFVLPDDRHLVMGGRLEWDDLARLYPERFETVRPRLLSREDQTYAASVRTLDSLVKLAQLNRTEVTIPRLQPTVKWPSDRPPEIDWKDLDTVLAPWMSGDAFVDKVPIGNWPLPAPDQLGSYDRKSQLEYWKSAAEHFDQQQWLSRSPVTLESPVSGHVGTAESLQMSADAAQILSDHPHVRVALPLELDQVKLATKDSPNFVDPKNADRLEVAGPGIVFNTLIQKWPAEVKPPSVWLRTDTPGLVQYVGAGGDERDVRVWAWLAFLRQARLIQWGSALPRTSSATESADPDDLVWFYPGSWFGVDEPLATVQLKWLRRAQQDYEYLWLAKQRGEVINASLMARLLTKPVELQPGQTPDPAYALMSGTADPAAWSEGQKLLAKVILLREPGQDADKDKANALALDVLHWSRPQDGALLMARTTDWGYSLNDNQWLTLTMGLDIYNASDTKPDQNHLQWTSVPRGWEVQPQPVTLSALATYRVDRLAAQARFNLEALDAKDHRPAEITFTNGFNNQESKLQFVLPVAATDRLGPGLKIDDGKLDDWSAADQIQNGPLVRMLNRPALQKQELQPADETSAIYTGWADQNFYIAFHLNGISHDVAKMTRNFVDYQFRRAWGEDLCEILIQPVFDDGTLGPVLHIVCKPTAGQWVERKGDAHLMADPWQPFEGSGIRYTSRVEGGWTGELAIPWRDITNRDSSGRDRGIPKLLRFNFSQHINSTGESASWAGPIDFGRDDSLMGLLVVRDLQTGGPGVPGR